MPKNSDNLAYPALILMDSHTATARKTEYLADKYERDKSTFSAPIVYQVVQSVKAGSGFPCPFCARAFSIGVFVSQFLIVLLLLAFNHSKLGPALYPRASAI
jgi:hypothetical protein